MNLGWHHSFYLHNYLETVLQSEEINSEEEIAHTILFELNTLEVDDKSNENEVCDWLNRDCDDDGMVIHNNTITDAITKKPKNEQ